MATNDVNDPAVYGPINGQYVTLSQWQAYETNLARNACLTKAGYPGPQWDDLTAVNELFARCNQATYSNPNPPAPTPPKTPLLPHDGFTGVSPGSYCDIWWNDPLCSVWGGGSSIFSPVAGTIIEQPIIIANGLNSTDVHGIVDNALNSVWSAIVGSVDLALALEVGSIQSALTSLGNAIKASHAIAMRLSGFILIATWTAIKYVEDLILQALKDVRDILKRLLKDVIIPLARGLANLRKTLMDIYEKFIRPVLVVLQDIRRVLGMLAAFHVPYAAKLDRILADLERKISGPFLLLLRFSNALANWMNLVFTNSYLVRRSVFLRSLKSYIGSAVSMQVNAINRPPSPADYVAGLQAIKAPTPRETAAESQQFYMQGTGAMVQPIAEAGELLKTLLQDGLPG